MCSFLKLHKIEYSLDRVSVSWLWPTGVRYYIRIIGKFTTNDLIALKLLCPNAKTMENSWSINCRNACLKFRYWIIKR